MPLKDLNFIVGCEDGLFPSQRALEQWDKGSDHALQEERRLFYVGITRSESRLFLSYAQMRSLWGYLNVQRPTRFLKELPTHCLH
jgi:DNA helicase II / ATP-dependent DNA helicase PcrA